MDGSLGAGTLAAFLAGMISFLSPCVLPLVPGYLSYVAGQSMTDDAGADRQAVLRVAGLSLLFVLGFSAVFIALGASATALGRALLGYRYETNLAAGIGIGLSGLLMTGLLPLPWLQRELRFHARIAGGSALGALALGSAFAFGWTPCIGPVLGSILTLSAATATVSSGVRLLAVYSLGLGVPFMLAAAFTGSFVRRLRVMRRVGRSLQLATGLVLMAMGGAMITGQTSLFATWFLQIFPVLQTIG